MLEVFEAVRQAVGPLFPVGIRINATDQMEGGLTAEDAIEVVRLLDQTSIDLIDISGGTYFPGAKASSDGMAHGPYFLEFARCARQVTNVPLMLTGGFKQREQAVHALADGAVDLIGLARAMVIEPQLPKLWFSDPGTDPEFPRFQQSPAGAITAWYTMRLSAIGNDSDSKFDMDLPEAMRHYEERDAQRCAAWRSVFQSQPQDH